MQHSTFKLFGELPEGEKFYLLDKLTVPGKPSVQNIRLISTQCVKRYQHDDNSFIAVYTSDEDKQVVVDGITVVCLVDFGKFAAFERKLADEYLASIEGT